VQSPLDGSIGRRPNTLRTQQWPLFRKAELGASYAISFSVGLTDRASAARARPALLIDPSTMMPDAPGGGQAQRALGSCKPLLGRSLLDHLHAKLGVAGSIDEDLHTVFAYGIATVEVEAEGPNAVGTCSGARKAS